MSKATKPGRNKIISRLSVQDGNGNGKAKEFFFAGPLLTKPVPAPSWHPSSEIKGMGI